MVLGTGIISPSRRVKIMASINGRVERILFKEGAFVNQGGTLAFISTIERISLIDIARANLFKARSTEDNELIKEAEEEYQTAKNAYSPVPIIASISGEIINRDIEMGEYITPEKTLFVLSDRLMLKINIDEAVIEKIKTDQEVSFYLDSSSDEKQSGKVKMISEEGILFANVMQYEVIVSPDNPSKKWVSGMPVTAGFYIGLKPNILSLPSKAVKKFKNKNFVVVLENEKKILKEVETGIFDYKNIQIVNGIDKEDQVLILSPSEFKLFFKKRFFPIGVLFLFLFLIIIIILLVLIKLGILPKLLNIKFNIISITLKKWYKKLMES